jgi:hypothetical protein
VTYKTANNGSEKLKLERNCVHLFLGTALIVLNKYLFHAEGGREKGNTLTAVVLAVSHK